MAKHTVKVGISGKYGTRYGSSLSSASELKSASTLAIPDSAFCGTNTVRRVSFGIWKCHGQGCTKILSGAYMLATPAAATATSTLRRPRDIASTQVGRA
ncbi:ribosomal protein L37ae [Pseudoneurospora amorphoporcata]|uniref:Ribosomal protein L37ae n=1 Tax=Pseudoneurospora amorphoporcata TaxID=241081 RepID=A0AAN6NUV5_9PEZI|nr:ribosomal protein L37ae [Pseudoneurospora amorphoporcata]